MAIQYEWQIEECDAHDDIITSTAYDSLTELKRCYTPTNEDGGINRIVLVRSTYSYEDLDDREWAYVDNGTLPTHFIGSNGRPTTPVPAKYLKQWQQAVS